MLGNNSLSREWAGYIVPILFSTIVSTIAYVVAQQIAPDNSLVVTLTAGIVSYLVADSFFFVTKVHAMDESFRQEVRALDEALRHEIRSTVQFRKFPSARDALDYIGKNAEHCRVISNTRLEATSAMTSSGPGRKAMTDFDKAVLAAVAKGTDYVLAYDETRRKDVEVYDAPLKSLSSSRGKVGLYELSTGQVPVPQLTILDYRDGRQEALVGWAAGNFRHMDAPVYLITGNGETGAIKLFRYTFDNYLQAAKSSKVV